MARTGRPRLNTDDTAILRLRKEKGWGSLRISRELGLVRNTVENRLKDILLRDNAYLKQLLRIELEKIIKECETSDDPCATIIDYSQTRLAEVILGCGVLSKNQYVLDIAEFLKSISELEGDIFDIDMKRIANP